MNRWVPVWLSLPLVALVWAGLVAGACKGGGAFDELDGSTEGGLMGRAINSAAADGATAASGDACAQATGTIDDSAAAQNASSGAAGCADDIDAGN